MKYNDLRKKITDKAFKDIILNEKYSYTTFIKELDKNILTLWRYLLVQGDLVLACPLDCSISSRVLIIVR